VDLLLINYSEASDEDDDDLKLFFLRPLLLQLISVNEPETTTTSPFLRSPAALTRSPSCCIYCPCCSSSPT
jgi:hypothetical protein